jgi:hypothetical protein
MARFRQTVREITLPSAAVTAQTVYTWDNPVSEPTRVVSIVLSSEGRSSGTGDIEWEVFYVTKWNGAAFDSDSTPTEGVSQASGLFVCPQEIYEVIYEDDSDLPANKKVAAYSSGAIDLTGTGGAAIVLKLTNVDIANAVTLKVTFVSGTVSDSN